MTASELDDATDAVSPLSNSDFSAALPPRPKRVAKELAAPNLATKDFARFRAWWKTDVFRLGHNAVRVELADAFSIFEAARDMDYALSPELVRSLETWWKDFDQYISLYLDVEDTILFPWIAEADRMSSGILQEVTALRRSKETILNRKRRLLETFTSLSQRSSTSLAVILPKMHESFHRFATELVEFMETMETKLVPIVDANFQEDDKFLMDITYVRRFYVENGRTDNLIFLTRWMDENGMVAYWLDTNLPKSVKNQYMTWKEAYLSDHGAAVEEFRAAAERVSSPESESHGSSFHRDPSSRAIRLVTELVGKSSVDRGFDPHELILLEYGAEWLWSRDVLTLGDNAVRKELSEITEIVGVFMASGLWASSEEPAELSKWWQPTQNFVQDFFDGEVELIFPWLEQISDDVSAGAQADIGKARHAGRVAETAFTKFSTLIDNFVRYPSESACREMSQGLDSLLAKTTGYFAEKESLVPAHIAKFYTEKDKRELDTRVTEYYFHPPRERSSLVLLLNWMDKDRRAGFMAANLRPGPRGQLAKLQKKVVQQHDRILADIRRKAKGKPGSSQKGDSIDEVRSRKSFKLRTS